MKYCNYYIYIFQKKAIELITKSNTKKKSHRIADEVSSNHKIASYCNSSQTSKKKRQVSVVGFSKSLALSEMQMYIEHQDWKHALNLFPTLLEYPNEVEPLVWKYAFIILLHTNDPSYLCEFFEQCAGTYSSNSSILLERLLSLPLQDNRS